jgi:hypothetical protein
MLTPDGLLDLWLTTPLPCQHPLRNKFEMLQWQTALITLSYPHILSDVALAF